MAGSFSYDVTKEDQMSFIMIEIKRGIDPMDIYSALWEVCGNDAMGRESISRLALTEPANIIVKEKDQKAYVKVQTFRRTPITDIEKSLRSILLGHTMSRSTLFRWSNQFRSGSANSN